MKRTSVLALIVILLCGSGMVFAETPDEMDARLERERVRIETERKAFNEDCRHVRHEDTAATSACSNRQAIIVFDMERWKQEEDHMVQSARTAQARRNLKAADLLANTVGVPKEGNMS